MSKPDEISNQLPLEQKVIRLARTMPDIREALDLLNQARFTVASRERVAANVKDQNLLRQLNYEIKRLNILFDETNIRAAVRSLYGEEGWARVRDEVRRMRKDHFDGVTTNYCEYQEEDRRR